jgi:HD superfamily phosphodiesterase
MESIISQAKKFVKENYGNDPDHGWDHISRVLTNAKNIIKSEKRFKNIDRQALTLAILFHDTGRVISKIDTKKDHHALRSAKIAKRFLKKLKYPKTNLVCQIILSHTSEAKTPEEIVLKDADYLDALGTIAIGRIFTYGGQKKRGLVKSLKYLEKKTNQRKLKTKYGQLIGEKKRAFAKKFILQMRRDLKV